MLPSRASDGGPRAALRILPNDVTYICGCNEPQTDSGTLCKGAEGCTARVCADCESAHKCSECGEVACSDHIVYESKYKTVSGKVVFDRYRALCDICRAEEEREPQSTEYQDAMPLESIQ